MKFARPLTHDLFASVILGFGGSLKRVVITKVVENTYYAELLIQRGSDLISIDARPSDSIAIALRMDAAIFTTEELLENTSVEISEGTEGTSGIIPEPETMQRNPGSLSPEELRDYLRRMNPEDFGRFTP